MEGGKKRCKGLKKVKTGVLFNSLLLINRCITVHAVGRSVEVFWNSSIIKDLRTSLAHLLKVAPLQRFIPNLSEVDITIEITLVFL